MTHSYPHDGSYPHYPSHHGYGAYKAGFPGYGEPYRTSGLSDVTTFGVLVPPIGIYQALSGSGGSSAGSHGVARRESLDWSLAAKVAIVAGGALAIYLIYHATKFSSSAGEKVGEGATKILAARYTGGAGSGKESFRLGSGGRSSSSNLFSGESARPQLLPRREVAEEVIEAVPVYESHSRS